MPGLLFGVLFFMLGMLLSQWHSLPKENGTEGHQLFVARLVSDLQLSGKIVKVEMELCRWDSDSSGIEENSKILAYLERSISTDSLRYGDIIVFNNTPNQVDGPTNPGEFDYREYLERKGIYYSVYLRNGSWKWLNNEPTNIWLSWAYKARRNMQEILGSTGLTEEEYAVASAILLGNDDMMNAELRENYVYAGAMHILCVSGLHVGIIYLIFNYLLGFLNKSKGLRVTKAFILLVLIWVYASVTGLSPSVQRAGLMVTIFIVGQLVLRKKDNLNTLATSAVVLLLFDPMLIFHIGFQLSYAAVAGILTLYPPIYQVIYVKNMFLDKIWSITALSLSAQLATFPLAVHYFHFFPSWFWLSNLVTYPLSFLILTGGMAFMFLSWVPIVSSILGWMLAGLVFVLNYLVGLVKWLPYPGLIHLHMPPIEVALVYLLIVLVFLFLSQRRWKVLLPIMVLIFVLMTIETVQHWQHLRQQGVVVYNIRKHSIIQVVNGRDAQMLTDAFIAADMDLASFSIKAAQSYWGLTAYNEVIVIGDTVPHSENSGYLRSSFSQVQHKRLMVLSDHDALYSLVNPLQLDMLIITGNPKITPDSLLNSIQVNTIIADGSVPSFLKSKLREMAIQSNIYFHDTSKEGAYIWGLE
jgi:competence protein ComEC